MLNKILRVLQLGYAICFYKRRLSKFLEISGREIHCLYEEIDNSNFLEEIKNKSSKLTRWYYLSMLSPFRAPLLYVICRVMQPDTVIETGVADGFSSSFILCALEKNKKGMLYSIDLPNLPGWELDGGRETGWLVPEELKPRWALILGSSKEELPLLLQNLQGVDVFYHDSDSSYATMMSEFSNAWNYLRFGGILLSDDVTENSAFDEFVEMEECKCLKLFKLGIAMR